ncbi:GNAT family N-acetyltransferase [Pseudolactococcus yaeyamensis]
MFCYLLVETDEKYPEILALYQRNRDYFALSPNSAVTLAQVADDVQSGPAQIATENKRYFLLTDDKGRPLGVLDYVLGYPDEQTVFIGLLVVDKPLQGQGIGRAIVTEQIAYFRSIGMSKVRLAVLENNPNGLAFWQGLGFEIVEENKHSTDGDLVHVLSYTL